ncbi:uncharacterized protein [Macrobrachium rosenbergii]|uniref:uncharacterized protein n=1 Tax=Macrobrachium rosenbergii TaxID=79674 RepID=UPI0034D697FB
MPFAAGLEAVVLCRVVPTKRAKDTQSSARKAGLLSVVVMMSRSPKLLIQRAFACDAVDLQLGQPGWEQSMIVRGIWLPQLQKRPNDVDGSTSREAGGSLKPDSVCQDVFAHAAPCPLLDVLVDAMPDEPVSQEMRRCVP